MTLVILRTGAWDCPRCYSFNDADVVECACGRDRFARWTCWHCGNMNSNHDLQCIDCDEVRDDT